jgi:hypothetical protein
MGGIRREEIYHTPGRFGWTAHAFRLSLLIVPAVNKLLASFFTARFQNQSNGGALRSA